MSVGVKLTETSGTFFITFTCLKWLPLIESINAYDLVYKWFDHLKGNGHFIVGYVIMPNHLHALIALRETEKSIHSVISNGKRFLAYAIVDRMRKTGKEDLLEIMYYAVTPSDRKRDKIHQVFKPSFDVKLCTNEWFLKEKLTFIHNNPCKGKWDLALSPFLYPHSSAGYYETGNKECIMSRVTLR